jgi:hypothetical protein
MKHLTAALVCVAVLYGIDAAWFDGWYFGALNKVVGAVWARGW